MQTELDILKWAAGAPVELPEDDAVDEERLCELLGYHRLGPRLLTRLDEVRCSDQKLPAWCTRTMMAVLLGEKMRSEKELRAKINAVQEIIAATGDDQPVFVVKGFSTYALTSDKRHVRRSSDIDLFGPDEERLFQTLLGLGYTGEYVTQEHHEYAGLQRGDTCIEIHRYLPVFSFPDGIDTVDLVPEHHPGTWRQALVEPPPCKVVYRDLLEHTVTGHAPGTETIRVLDVTMATLSLCTHESKAFTMPLFGRPMTIKLSMLADILDLTRHSEFDAVKFAHLVERFQARDTVRLVGYMIWSYFGVNAFGISIPESAEDSLFPYPRTLHNYGLWGLVSTSDEVIPPFDVQTIVDRLGYSTVVAGGQDERGMELRRILWAEREPLSFDAAISWESDSLHIEMALPPLTQPEQEYRAKVFGGPGGGFGHWARISSDGTVAEQGTSGHAAVLHSSGRQGDDWRIRFSFAWETLPTGLREAEALPFLVSATRHDLRREGFHNDDQLTLAPLRIVRPKSIRH
jgi:hypothetical protein